LVARFWAGRVVPVLAALAGAVTAFVGEAGFRISLAFDVLAGRVPKVRPRRWWNRALEPPILIDAFDWTDERLLFSVLVWPPLEDRGGQRERARQVLDVLHAGAADMNWSTLYDVDDGLTWDAGREVWVGSDGFAHDGGRLFAYSRGGRA
jgi:hypothetical protein